MKKSIKYIILAAIILVPILLFYVGVFNFNKQVSLDELTTSKNKHPDNEWILKILNYESCCGSSIGTGLPYWGFTGSHFAKKRPGNINDAIKLFHRYFLPSVKQFPYGAKQRLGDFYFNTGRSPEKFLLYASDIITLSQLKNKKGYKYLWSKHKVKILKTCRDKRFLKKIDDAKSKYYRSISISTYEATWKNRIYMWQ